MYIMNKMLFWDKFTGEKKPRVINYKPSEL